MIDSVKRTACFVIGAAAIVLAPVTLAQADPWFGGSPVNQSWYPQGRASLSVSASSARVALPTPGQIANVCNTGTVDGYAALGDVTVVTTSAAGYIIKAGTCKPLQLNPFGTPATYLAGITASSTSTLYIETGIGTPPKDDASTNASGTSTVNQGTSPWVTSATQSGAWTNTNTYQATASAAINISTATTTQIVALSAGKAIYISHIDFIAGGTDNVTLEYGTGSNCGTGTTVLTGAYGLLTGSGISIGSGIAPVLFIPASNAFCIVTSAAVQLSGFESHAQL